ncbi:hypothetical protein ACKKBF_B17830 [Auxenochlorella protothecoides x Auxenochlorella symbiontica]
MTTPRVTGREDISAAVKSTWQDASRVLIFTNSKVVHSTFETTEAERAALTTVFADRETALKQGLVLGGRRYEVHRFHPPLVYGRTMDGDAETSTGIAILKVDSGKYGSPTYALITYEMPNVSARMVQMLADFGKTCLED